MRKLLQELEAEEVSSGSARKTETAESDPAAAETCTSPAPPNLSLEVANKRFHEKMQSASV